MLKKLVFFISLLAFSISGYSATELGDDNLGEALHFHNKYVKATDPNFPITINDIKIFSNTGNKRYEASYDFKNGTKGIFKFSNNVSNPDAEKSLKFEYETTNPISIKLLEVIDLQDENEAQFFHSFTTFMKHQTLAAHIKDSNGNTLWTR